MKLRNRQFALWCCGKLVARASASAFGFLTFLIAVQLPAQAAEFGGPDRMMVDYQRVGAKQQSLIARMKDNLGEKRVLEKNFTELDAESSSYDREAAEASTFCRGTFSQEEFRRRTAICDTKQAELDTRHQIIETRRGELVKLDALRQQGAKDLKAAYGALAKNTNKLEEAMASDKVLSPIIKLCRDKKKSTARRNCIEKGWQSELIAVAQAELVQFTQKNLEWRQRQAGLVREAAARDKWRREVLASLEELRLPKPMDKPKDLADLMPGDVILLAPSLTFDISHVIPPAEWIYRVATSLASGEALATALRPPGEIVSHTAAAVKSVNGHLLFLDHTLEGSRILTKEIFEKKYGTRGIYVARPVLPVDGDKLWQAARKSALREGSDYGVRGENVVCSERIGIVVSKAIGRPLDSQLPGPIDITPADFLDKKRAGKYFIVSGIENPTDTQ